MSTHLNENHPYPRKAMPEKKALVMVPWLHWDRPMIRFLVGNQGSARVKLSEEGICEADFVSKRVGAHKIAIANRSTVQYFIQ